jgi:site-specific recombinase XerD
VLVHDPARGTGALTTSAAQETTAWLQGMVVPEQHGMGGPALQRPGTASRSLQVCGKGRTWRTVTAPPWLEQLITAYRARLGTGAPAPLLLSPPGARLAVRDLERLLGRAVMRARAADPARARAVVPHGLRHTAATLMLAEGWDVKVVARLLVRATLTTTSKYLDELPGKLSVAINAHPFTPVQT